MCNLYVLRNLHEFIKIKLPYDDIAFKLRYIQELRYHKEGTFTAAINMHKDY